MKISFKYTLLAAGCVMMLSSCDENSWNDKLDGFETPPPYTKTETVNYTLTAADYATIASNSTNKKLAEAAGESEALAAIGTNASFASDAEARKYIPALLSSSAFPYFALNNGSSIKVTYDLSSNQPAEVLAINSGVKTYTVSAADYQQAWGSEEDFINGFAPITPAAASLPNILKTAFPDAENGTYAVISYNEASTNPVFGNVGGSDAPQVYIDAAFSDGQGDFTMDNVLLPAGSTYIWSHDSRNGGYMKASGYVGGANQDCEGWLVSPEVTLSAKANAVLTFDQAWNFFKDLATAANEATVNIREKGGKWKQLTVPELPSKLSWDFIASGDIDLSAYNGKTVQIGFCYKSTVTKAGTWEVKNVKLVDGGEKSRASRAAAAEVPTVGKNAIYLYNGKAWAVPGSTVVLQPSDYTAMGQNYGNLSGTLPAQLLPKYLAATFPYASEEAAKIVAYKYYNGSTTSYHANQFTLTDGVWVENRGASVDQFSKMNGNWTYNPSVILTLPYSRNTEPSYSYYMACVNWVFANVTKKLYPDAEPANGTQPGPPFIDYRNNAEFYSGASAYYGNVDVRAVTAKNNAPVGYTGYDGLSDDEITALIKKRFCTETMKGALSIMHPDAAPVDGMEVTYTINFTAYDGAAKEISLVYVVTGPGQFTYRSCTWYENGEDAGWE